MRTVGSNQTKTLQAIRAASLDLIFRNGFSATGLRSLAQKSGLQVGSLYNYFGTKEDLLIFLIRDTLEGRVRELEERLRQITDPEQALREFLSLSFGYHTKKKEEMVIGNRELRSLSPKNLRKVIELRDRYDAHVTRIIEEGRKSGIFSVADARIAAFAIIAMISGISGWYRENGRLSDEKLLKMYVGYGLAIVGWKKRGKGGKAP